MDNQRDGNAGSVVSVSLDGYEEVAVAVTSAVATAAELNPLDLPPLADVGVDPEALETLFGTTHDQSLTFTFRYAGHLVTLAGDGSLTVDQEGG
ncbi:HalOD1 output domain-containing protein [Haloferax elongans]|uniref:HalOD1 output domain-containing protein n=1 Tax=Haloferax elongans TaxID=403191 RepID=UPI000677F871|nr:HalOD1 output domain-containing protein [Haloferax elongans]